MARYNEQAAADVVHRKPEALLQLTRHIFIDRASLNSSLQSSSISHPWKLSLEDIALNATVPVK
jgi:hypothetical protein